MDEDKTDEIKLDEILEGLLRHTQAGKLKWQTSADPNVFVTAVGAVGLVVRSFGHPGRVAVRLEITRPQGQVVGQIESDNRLVGERAAANSSGASCRDLAETSEISEARREKALSELFSLARRSALKSDEILDRLARSLAALK